MASDPKTEPELLTVWVVAEIFDAGRYRMRLVSAEVSRTPTRYRFHTRAGGAFLYRNFLEAKQADFTPEAAIDRVRRNFEAERESAYERAKGIDKKLDELRNIEVAYLDTKGAHRGP